MHFTKAFSSILFNEDGVSNVTFSSDEHSLNALFPMFVTEKRMCISINEEQNTKEPFSICFTDEGMLISESEEQSINEKLGVDSIKDSITTFIKDENLTKLEILNWVNNENPLKEPCPIEATVEEMVSLVSE